MNSIEVRPNTASTEIPSKKNSPSNALLSKPSSPHLNDEDFKKFISNKLLPYKKS